MVGIPTAVITLSSKILSFETLTIVCPLSQVSVGNILAVLQCIKEVTDSTNILVSNLDCWGSQYAVFLSRSYLYFAKSSLVEYLLGTRVLPSKLRDDYKFNYASGAAHSVNTLGSTTSWKM